METNWRDLDDMVFEVDVLLLLPASVLNVENTDQVRRPAPNDAVEELQEDAGEHAQLGEGVWQR